MTSKTLRALLLASVVISTAACGRAGGPGGGTASVESKNTATETAKDSVTSAQAAAPGSVSGDASIVAVDDKGAMTTLVKGTNGWTCMPDVPVKPGPSAMCFDQNAAAWVAAWVAHKPPPANTVGLVYMLAGGTDASNTDPYATKPTASNSWVKTGPHIMVVGSKDILVGHPSGPRPDTSVPYVMWAGTPYAHLMIPVGFKH